MAKRRRPEGDPVVKQLFALSGNRCAFFDPDGRDPACEVQLADPTWRTVNAIICHIHGWNPGSQRYVADMTDDERNAYENLILLCPNHSYLIDVVRPDDFPAEKLKTMKERSDRANEGVHRMFGPEDLNRFVASAIALTEAWQVMVEQITVVGVVGATMDTDLGGLDARITTSDSIRPNVMATPTSDPARGIPRPTPNIPNPGFRTPGQRENTPVEKTPPPRSGYGSYEEGY